jgi:uncharacterized protein (DUF2267 family)
LQKGWFLQRVGDWICLWYNPAMPMPQEYQIATQVYERILTRTKDELDLATRNQAYTTLQSVLTVFRRRLRPEQVLQFADALPALIRAIFVADWQEGEFTTHFGSREQLTLEVKSVRQNHNFSPDNSISGVVVAIRSNTDENRLDTILNSYSEDAQSFWAT